MLPERPAIAQPAWHGAGNDARGAAMQGSDIVVHCAGLVQLAASGRDEVFRVNVGGTERLAAASAHAGLSRFVHLSSVAVYGHAAAPAVCGRRTMDHRDAGPDCPGTGHLGESGGP